MAVSYKWCIQLTETVQISTKWDWLNNRRQQGFPGANRVAERLLCTAGDIALITQPRTPLSSILLFLHSHGSRMVVRVGEGLRKTLWSHGATEITLSTMSNKKTNKKTKELVVEDGCYCKEATNSETRMYHTHFSLAAQKLYTITSTVPQWAPKISVSISVSPIQCEIWRQSTLLVPELEQWIMARKVL